MIDVPQFRGPLTSLLREVFGLSDMPTGYFLDSGESGLLGLTKSIDAVTASAVYLPGHETIAAHCGHVLYTLDLFLALERGERPQPDWAATWATQAVDEAGWAGLQAGIQSAYDGVMAALAQREEWPQPAIGAGLMLLAHTAYHVGVVHKMITLQPADQAQD